MTFENKFKKYFKFKVSDLRNFLDILSMDDFKVIDGHYLYRTFYGILFEAFAKKFFIHCCISKER